MPTAAVDKTPNGEADSPDSGADDRPPPLLGAIFGFDQPDPEPPPLPTRTPGPGPRFSPSLIPAISPGQLAQELAASSIDASVWTTNFRLRNVPYSEIEPGGPGKDGIRSLTDPSFVSVDEADKWLGDRSPVQFVKLNGEAAAYPLMILIWHEIVNDVLAGKPIVITYCPLCNTAIVFESTVENTVLDFGATGLLRFSNLIMYDRQTESWWQQVTGEAIAGDLTGKQLEFIPTSIVSFGDFKEAHPDGKVMSLDTGYNRQYGINPYYRYDSDEDPFLFHGPEDGRLKPIDRVVTIDADGDSLAVPLRALEKERVVNHYLAGRHLTVFYKPGTASALDDSVIGLSRDVGATGVFESVLDGRELDFRWDGQNIVDGQTGSRWDIFGRAETGPLTGRSLQPVVHGNHFWFSWAVFKPDTKIYAGRDSNKG